VPTDSLTARNWVNPHITPRSLTTMSQKTLKISRNTRQNWKVLAPASLAFLLLWRAVIFKARLLGEPTTRES
jgi:hypothetical protein